MSNIAAMKRSHDYTGIAGSRSLDFSKASNDVVSLFVATSRYKNVLRLVCKQFYAFASFLRHTELLNQHARIVYVSPLDRERIYMELVDNDNCKVMQDLLSTDEQIQKWCNNPLQTNPLKCGNSAGILLLESARSYNMRELLLRSGARISFQKDVDLRCITLWKMIMQGDIQSLQLFLKNKEFNSQDFMSQNNDGYIALDLAALFGCYDAAKLILEACPESKAGSTALVLATGPRYQTHEALVELLLEHGLDPEGDVTLDYTPLYGLIKSGNISLITKCVQAGAKIKQHDGYSDKYNDYATPLIHAIATQNPAVVRTIVELGANVNEKKEESELPLEMARRLGNQEIIDIIVGATT